MSPAQFLVPRDSPQDSKVKLINNAFAIPIPIIIFATGLRVYARWSRNLKLSLDDYLIILASFFVLGQGVIILGFYVPAGFGRHGSTLSTADTIAFGKASYAYSHFYDFSLGAVKLAIIAVYYRIFTTRAFRLILIGFAAVICVWEFGMTLGLILLCRPIKYFWDASVKGHCGNLVAFTYFTNIFNLITDVILFVLPIPLIWRLQLSRQKRLALISVFSIGLACCAISVVRLQFVTTQKSTDPSYDQVTLGIFSYYEPFGGILVANLPIVYPLLADWSGVYSTQVRSMMSTRKSQHDTNRSRSKTFERLDPAKEDESTIGLTEIVHDKKQDIGPLDAIASNDDTAKYGDGGAEAGKLATNKQIMVRHSVEFKVEPRGDGNVR